MTTLQSGLSLLVVGQLIGLGVALLVGYVERRCAKRQREEAEQQLKQRVRTLLRIEIAENLASLKKYWEVVAETPSGGDKGQFAQRVWFAQNSMPAWSKEFWLAQADNLALALTEEEIMSVLALQQEAESIVELRSKVTPPPEELVVKYEDWQNMPAEERSNEQNSMGVVVAPYNRETDTEWFAWRNAMAELVLRTPNPLGN